MSLIKNRTQKTKAVYDYEDKTKYFNFTLIKKEKQEFYAEERTLYKGSCSWAFNLACPVLSPDAKIISPCFPTRSISEMYAGGVYVDSENFNTLKQRHRGSYIRSHETHHNLAPLHLIPTVIEFVEGLTSTEKHICFMPLAFMVRGGPP